MNKKIHEWILTTVRIFNLLLIPILLFWGWQLISVKAQINEIKAELLEDCYDFECEVDLFGQLFCEKKKFNVHNIPIIIEHYINITS